MSRKRRPQVPKRQRVARMGHGAGRTANGRSTGARSEGPWSLDLGTVVTANGRPLAWLPPEQAS